MLNVRTLRLIFHFSFISHFNSCPWDTLWMDSFPFCTFLDVVPAHRSFIYNIHLQVKFPFSLWEEKKKVCQAALLWNIPIWHHQQAVRTCYYLGVCPQLPTCMGLLIFESLIKWQHSPKTVVPLPVSAGIILDLFLINPKSQNCHLLWWLRGKTKHHYQDWHLSWVLI